MYRLSLKVLTQIEQYFPLVMNLGLKYIKSTSAEIDVPENHIYKCRVNSLIGEIYKRKFTIIGTTNKICVKWFYNKICYVQF